MVIRDVTIQEKGKSFKIKNVKIMIYIKCVLLKLRIKVIQKVTKAKTRSKVCERVPENYKA